MLRNSGRRVAFPVDTTGKFRIPLAKFSAGLGEDVALAEVKKYLASYGHAVAATRGMITVSVPPYRDDIMHPMDLVEDFAISRGYESFEPVMPRQSTVGSLSRLELLSDNVRGAMVGAGFQEIMSNILCSREELAYAMPEGERLVEVDNVMSLAYSVLRNRVIPSLLTVETASSKAFYPHRIFEVGEVALFDEGENMGSRTELNLGALIAHPGANFSEMHSTLDILLYYLGVDYQLVPAAHPLFMQGRCGAIIASGTELGPYRRGPSRGARTNADHHALRGLRNIAERRYASPGTRGATGNSKIILTSNLLQISLSSPNASIGGPLFNDKNGFPLRSVAGMTYFYYIVIISLALVIDAFLTRPLLLRRPLRCLVDLLRNQIQLDAAVLHPSFFGVL